MDGVKYRISKGQGYLVIGIALVIDIIGMVVPLLELTGIGAIVEFIVTIIILVAIWFWFKIKRVELLNRKNIKKNVSFFSIETLPVIDALPGYSLAVFMSYRNSRKEDEEKFKKNQEQNEQKINFTRGGVGNRRFSNQKIRKMALTEARLRASGERVASRRSRRKAPGGKEVGDNVAGTYN